MKLSGILAALISVSVFSSCEFLDDGDGGGLTDDEIVEGLKEALSVGLNTSVANASATDGYLQNEFIKIFLPEEVVSLQNQINSDAVLNTAYSIYISLENDGDDLFADLVTAMNRGAEDAAGTALPIFGNAVANMTFEDARNILNSNNPQEATDFFERETRAELITAFSPNVEEALVNTEASALYSSIVEFLNYEVVPFTGITVGSLLETDPDLPATLDEYATGKAVDGLFYLVGEEEAKIRADPFAWGNAIIEKVFGSI